MLNLWEVYLGSGVHSNLKLRSLRIAAELFEGFTSSRSSRLLACSSIRQVTNFLRKPRSVFPFHSHLTVFVFLQLLVGGIKMQWNRRFWVRNKNNWSLSYCIFQFLKCFITIFLIVDTWLFLFLVYQWCCSFPKILGYRVWESTAFQGCHEYPLSIEPEPNKQYFRLDWIYLHFNLSNERAKTVNSEHEEFTFPWRQVQLIFLVPL